MIKSVKMKNLTPHEVVVYDDKGDVKLRVKPSGTIARVTTKQEVVGYLNGVPVVKTEFVEVQGLPKPEDNTVYIVSSLVAQAVARERGDVVAPDTSPRSAVRDEQGRIIGVRRFQRW